MTGGGVSSGGVDVGVEKGGVTVVLGATLVMSVRVTEMLGPVWLGTRVTTVPPPTVVVAAAVPVGATSVEPPMTMVPPDGIGYGVPLTMTDGG